MNPTNPNPKLGDYRAYFHQRLQEDPEYRAVFINSCLEEADDSEVTEEEYLVTLVQCLKDIVESYGSVDKFLKKTHAPIPRNTIYHLFGYLDESKRKRGPDFTTIHSILRAIGYTFRVHPVQQAASGG